MKINFFSPNIKAPDRPFPDRACITSGHPGKTAPIFPLVFKKMAVA